MDWEYYTFADGLLCDDDGADCFPGHAWATAAAAEQWLADNDIRGSVR